MDKQKVGCDAELRPNQFFVNLFMRAIVFREQNQTTSDKIVFFGVCWQNTMAGAEMLAENQLGSSFTLHLHPLHIQGSVPFGNNQGCVEIFGTGSGQLKLALGWLQQYLICKGVGDSCYDGIGAFLLCFFEMARFLLIVFLLSYLHFCCIICILCTY